MLTVGLVLSALCLFVLPRFTFRERLVRNPQFFRDDRPQPATTKSSGSDRTLAVVFHGMAGSHEALQDVTASIHDALPAADLLFPQYPAGVFSNEDPLVVTRFYLQAIDLAMRQNHYEKLIFIGHSVGGLLARKVYVCARMGCSLEHSDLISTERPWWRNVERIIQLAGMNRGWATHCDKERDEVGSDCRANRISPWLYAFAELGQRTAPPLGIARFAMAGRRGAPFVANLRIEWINLTRIAVDDPPPPVIQLLGDEDDVVSGADNTDTLVTGDFIFKQLPQTNHLSAARIREPGHQERERIFLEALTTPHASLGLLNEFKPRDTRKPNPGVEHVILIVHGIRDQGEWAVPLGDLFERQAPGKIVSVYRSYGYFPALHFLMRERMEENVRWFVDQYTEQFALYPNATISFVGHSNGTYVIAKALQDYDAIKFDRVFLAGSVIPTGFRWSNYVGRDRVHAIRNLVASDDKVVALLPAVFEYFPGILDVGSAGHNGFDDQEGRRYETRYVSGGHSAALRPENFDAIVNFILNRPGCDQQGIGNRRLVDCAGFALPPSNVTSRQNTAAVLINRFCVVEWCLTVLALLAVFAGLTKRVFQPANANVRARYLIPAAGYVLVIFAVLRYV
ncbi:MAG: hypothetical protein M3N54_16505 [Acidobacteriota bacterium]|nr:hypothetical protein [Acidobacteriota bacterium]